MKKLFKGSTVLGIVCAAVLALAPSASASTLSAAGKTCQFVNETGRIVTSMSLYAGSDLVGTVAVCRDDSYNYWGYVGFREKLTASQWAQATLYRQRDGSSTTSVTCDSSGGNGKVMPNQRVCWTPKFTGLSSHYQFLAAGEMYSSHTGTQLAFDTTREFAR